MPQDAVVLKIQRELCTRNAPEKFGDFWETGPWAQISTTIKYSVYQWMDGIISPLTNLAPAFNGNKTTKKYSLISVPDERALPTRMATSSLLLNTDITAVMPHWHHHYKAISMRVDKGRITYFPNLSLCNSIFINSFDKTKFSSQWELFKCGITCIRKTNEKSLKSMNLHYWFHCHCH